MSSTHVDSGRLQELLKTITAGTSAVDSYLREHNLPQPSFDEHGPVNFGIKSPDVEITRANAAEAALELHDLLVGPARMAIPWMNAAPLQAIYKLNIVAKVPVNGSISFADLAKACDLHEIDMRRIIRYAIVYHRLFQEKVIGQISHSAASKHLLNDSNTFAWFGLWFDEFYQGYGRTVESLQTFKNFERYGAGWCLARNTDLDIWDYYARHPEYATRFGKAMAGYSQNLGQDPQLFIEGYDWNSLGSSLIVDVGGGTGHISLRLAQAYPNLRFVVQDLPAQIKQAAIPVHLVDRVQTMTHDFFTPQTLVADVYMFRIILHDWSDVQSLDILRALTPALRPGARVLLNDAISQPPGVLPFDQEKQLRAIDLCMMCVQNSYEREEEDWRRLFRQADTRWAQPTFLLPKGATNGIIEVVWNG